MSEQMRSAELLVETALNTPGVLDELVAKPKETLRRLESQALKTTSRALEADKWVYRMVVGALGIVVIAVALGVIYLTSSVKPPVAIPDVLTALGSAAIGALAGLLAPSPGGQA